MSEAMWKYWKAKAERLQSKINRIENAYTNAETDAEFSEAAFLILQEGTWDD